MTLRQKQSIFLKNVAILILWIFEQKDMEATGGELMRPQEMHDIYVKKGLSKAKRSKHQDRLALDINLFIKGVYQTGREPYKPLSEKWKSLHPSNVAGYDWGWDANHFEMK